MTFEPPLPNQRSDALRSRARLLEAAADAFATTDAPTLKEIAKYAEVGIGTLFRHFPTREALVEAVYRAELTRLCDDAPALLDTLPADEALRTWMGRWSAFVATKRGMAATLQGLAATGAVTKSESGLLLTTAIQSLLESGSAAGTLRDDVPATDVTAALAGILSVAGSIDQQEQAERLLDLLMDGLTAAPRRRIPLAQQPKRRKAR
jgi:AcrR family transcriptional regulator